MQSLIRGLNSKSVAGRPLPTVFPSLAARGGNFNMGEVSMLAGQPGAGKSAIALWHAHKWVTEHSLRGIYFSADGRKLAVASRIGGMALDVPAAQVKDRLLSGDESFATAFKETEGLEWCFDSEISYESVDLNVNAFEEKWGEPPAFVIVDNLTDVPSDGDDEYRALRQNMVEFNILAGHTDAHIMVLHHVSEDAKEDPCPPRKAIHGKVSRKPTLVLTTAQARDGRQPIAIVKTREAEFDKSGRTAVWIGFDGASMRYQDWGS